LLQWLRLTFLIFPLQSLIIEKIQESISWGDHNKRVIYLGDGSGDYCPSLRLKDKDFVMPRKNYPVWELICKDPLLTKAEIHEWSHGEEREQISLQLINKISLGESVQNNISADCKLADYTSLFLMFYQFTSKTRLILLSLEISHLPQSKLVFLLLVVILG